MNERKRVWLLIQGEVEIQNGREVMVEDEVIGATYDLNVAEEVQAVLVSASRKNDQTIVRSTVTALPKVLHDLVKEPKPSSLLEEILASSNIKVDG